MNLVELEHKGKVVVIRLRGRIDYSNVTEIREWLKERLGGRSKHIIVNLAEVDFVDSSGLGLFVLLYKEQQAKGKELRIAEAQTEVAFLLGITNLNSILQTHDSEAEALASIESR